MKSKLTHWTAGILEACWLFAIVATPLFFNIHSDRVFEPDKITLLRSLAVTMAVIWLIGFVDQRGWRDLDWLRWRSERSLWRTPFVLPVVAIAVVYLLSTLFSVTPHVSWAGSYQRLQGTYSTLSYITVFAVMAATLRSREQVRRVVTTLITTSIAVSLYAMLQHFGLDPLPWGGDTQRRVAANMGNSIFVGAYLILAVPFTLARILDAFADILREEDLPYADVVRSSVYIFALAVQLIALYWTQSRGPAVGLAVSIYAFLLVLLVSLRNRAAGEAGSRAADLGRAALLLVSSILISYALLRLGVSALSGRVDALDGGFGLFAAAAGSLAMPVVVILVFAGAGRGWRWLWMTWLGLAAVGFAAIVLFNFSDELLAAGDAPFESSLEQVTSWQRLPAVGRFGQLLNAEEGSGRVRVLIWAGVVEMLGPGEPLAFPEGETDPYHFLRPVLGYGPESMYVAYNRFYQPELATIESRNATPDRSHNETFDALVITGFGGFLAWQLLYFSVIFFGFGWLGVLRTKRDKIVFTVLWISMALLAALLFSAWLGLVYLGVALPLGSVVGLVLYLIYYALVVEPDEATRAEDPFQADRLLLIALMSAVIGHYLEIHLGIAIAATRLHFFVFLALLLVVGQVLRPAGEEVEAEGTPADEGKQERGRRGRRRATRRARGSIPAWAGPVLGTSLVLGLMTGVLGWVFITFSLPPGQQLATISDVPPAGEIFRQSLLVNVREGFTDSPYLYLMIVFSWVLALLAHVSELVKSGVLGLNVLESRRLAPQRLQLATLLFALLVALTLLFRFVGGDGAAEDATAQLGRVLSLLWGGLCVLAAVYLPLGSATGRFIAALVALTGLLFAIPVAVAGNTLFGIILAIGCGAILYLIWDDGWNRLLAPAGIMGLLSISIGFAIPYYQARLIRLSIIGPNVADPVARAVAQSDMRAAFLSGFYALTFLALFAAGTLFAARSMQRARGATSLVALGLLLPATIGLVWIVLTTNLRVVQADIIYKWARPFDQNAGAARSQGDVETSLLNWDQSIAIFEHALEVAPLEDFYYLFLGRAYLEKSATVQNPVEAENLLQVAEDRLLRAAEINPLNTDHTANLARLSSRWGDTATSDDVRITRYTAAENYYVEALALSPQNSVIWNEYARLAFAGSAVATGLPDCDRAAGIYQDALAADPFYEATYIQLGEMYLECGNLADDDAARDAYYASAAEMFAEGFDVGAARPRRPVTNPNPLVQAAQLYRQLGNYEQALDVLARARPFATDTLPIWSIDYQTAVTYEAAGRTADALAVASDLLTTVPVEVVPEVEAFIDTLGAEDAP